MTKSAVITVVLWGAFVILIGYGLFCDWRRRRQHIRAEKRAERWLATLDEIDRQEIELRCERVFADPDAEPDEEWEPPLVARTEQQLERLINVPAAPNPRRLA